MRRSHSSQVVGSWIVRVLGVGFAVGWVFSSDAPLSAQVQPPPESSTSGGGDGETAVRGQGEVTTNDVYVRSGDSLNHYTICKLNAGARVSIVGERGEWYEIVPPEGTFSLVSGDYVDTVDQQSGVINGNNIRIRAGSLLNDNKYTVQALLTKGTQVAILGRNPDGFLRIKPPAGATLWINRAYVQPVSTGEASSGLGAHSTPSAEASARVTTRGADPTESVGVRPAADLGRSKTSPLTVAPTTAWRRQLDEVDTTAREELAKPAAERNYAPLIDRYRAIANQTEDDFARQYAQSRMEQIENMAALAEAVNKVRQLDVDAETRRREYLATRSSLPETIMPVPRGIEIQGELRVSALYPPGSAVRRYRLVDPEADETRTIGYVEIPPDSTLQADPFLGRYVGVRATQQRLQAGGVDPVPIYLAQEFVPLEGSEAGIGSRRGD